MNKLIALMVNLETDKKKFIKTHIMCFLPAIVYAVASVFLP